MPLIALAADKGAPGVTTAALALGVVWPRPVLLAECDTAGGDLVYRLPNSDGASLNPSQGLLSLATTARRGLRPEAVWEHRQKLSGGLDVLIGVLGSEQAKGLDWLWQPLGQAFAGQQAVDVLADCGRIGAAESQYDLLAAASTIVLVTRSSLEEVVRLRERISALTTVMDQRRARPMITVVVVGEPKRLKQDCDEVAGSLSRAGLNAPVAGGIAHDDRGAGLLRGQFAGRLDRSMLLRTARQVAASLVGRPATTA